MAGGGRGEEGIRLHTGIRQPVQRKIEPAVPGILAHIAGDVGELHGNA
jgi:hypothetical protein